VVGMITSILVAADNLWRDVQDSQGVSASEMTYIVSGGALNSTRSLSLEMRPEVTVVI